MPWHRVKEYSKGTRSKASLHGLKNNHTIADISHFSFIDRWDLHHKGDQGSHPNQKGNSPLN